MKKTYFGTILIVILGIILVEIPQDSILYPSTNIYNESESYLRSNYNGARWNGTILLESNSYYEIHGFVNHSFSFNFKSVDSNNSEVYIDLMFLVMDETLYNNFLYSLNLSNNLLQIINSYPARESIVGDESHYCFGSYCPSHPQILHFIFANLNQDQNTSKLTYTIRFEEQIRPEPVEDDDENPLPIENLPFSVFNILFVLVASMFIVICVITVFIVSKSYSKYRKHQLGKYLDITKPIIKQDPVLFCCWCGFNLTRVVKYCPRCGKEMDY